MSLHNFRILVTAVVVLFAIAPAAADSEPTTEYVVKQGDTCLKIAIGVLGNRSHLTALHRLNPDLGAAPHILKAGQKLRLPAVAKREADAKIGRAHNVVEVRRAGDDAWNRAQTGAELYQAWRVGARKSSTAEIVFADTSAIEMRENTVVVIYGVQTASAGPRKATLETGALRTRLAELGGRPVEVLTPSARVGMALGDAVIEVGRTGATLVSNHRGSAAMVGAKVGAARRVKVAPGFGVDVQRGKQPSAPRPLPPAPVWRGAPAVAVGWSENGASLITSWDPATAAASYRFWLTDEQGTTLLALDLPAAASSIQLHRLPERRYVLALAAVDATGLESQTSVTPPITSVLVSLPGDAPAPSGELAAGAAPLTRTVAFGSSLTSSAGATCTSNGSVTLTTAGSTAIRCEANGGAAELPVVVDRVTVSAMQRSGTLRVGTPGLVTVLVASTLPPVGTLVALGDDGLQVGTIEPIGSAVRVEVTATVPGKRTLTLAVRGPGGDSVIGTSTLDATVAASAPVVPLRPASFGHRIWLGAALGAAANEAATAPLGSVAVDVGVAAHLGITAELAAARHDDLPALLRVGATVPFDLGRFTVIGRLGGVASFDGHAGAFVGLGARYSIARRWAITSTVDGIAVDSAPRLELTLGLAVNL